MGDRNGPEHAIGRLSSISTLFLFIKIFIFTSMLL